MHLVHTSTQKLSCHFLTLVVRNDALNRLYDGGLNGFMSNNPARCNQDITVDCYMGGDIDDTIRDLVASGLVRGQDFVVFDAVRIAMHPDPTLKREPLETSVAWLKATCSGGGVFVWFNTEGETR